MHSSNGVHILDEAVCVSFRVQVQRNSNRLKSLVGPTVSEFKAGDVLYKESMVGWLYTNHHQYKRITRVLPVA